MPAKTYIPTLIRIVKWIVAYMSRYQTTIESNLPGATEVALFRALLDAAVALLAAVEIVIED